MQFGKKFPQDIRAMRLVLEELLRSTIRDCNFTSMEELLTRLDQVASESSTSKLWVDCFIKPVFIMMLYIRVERESDWPLHLVAVKQMLPYFFATAHESYARYDLYYLRPIERLGPEEISMFMTGEHVMHHVPGIWNGIWSDMFIETTFMCYGHGPKGIIGITLKPETLKTWALGLHICSRLEQELVSLVGKEQDTRQEVHKEEMKARIVSHGSTISKKLKTVLDSKKHIKVGAKKVYDTSVIYSRVMGIQASSRDIDTKEVLMHELAPVPTSMFHDSGAMRICKANSDLKKRLAKEASSRCCLLNVTSKVLDGSAVLWVVHWPAKGVIADFLNNFKVFLSKKLVDSDVYLIFDRYREYSTKNMNRDERACEASRVCQLTENTPLSSQKVALTVTANKKQLISIICSNTINDSRSMFNIL